jgi:pyrimidine and pyridine-specific 5'-nucleotidase
VQQLLRVRTVSQHWSDLTRVPILWQSLAHSLLNPDQRSSVGPAKEEDWEPFFRSLYRRERNWTQGLAQSGQLHPGHTSSVTAMRLRGETLVTGSYDGTIRVWTLGSSGHMSCRSTIKAEKLACLDFAGGERQGVIAAGLYDSGRVLVFDIKSGQLMQTLSGHNKGVRNIAVNKDHLVSVGQDKTICVWDWRSGERVARFGQQSNVALGVSLVGQDGLVAVSIDGIIRTFSIRGKKMIGEFHVSKLSRTDPRWTEAIKRFSADGGTLR